MLLLRGPQAPGELRTRTERLHAFADRTEVEAVLSAWPGARPRWCGSWSGGRDSRTPGGCTCSVRWRPSRRPRRSAVDREGVLRDGEEARTERVRRTFDAVAEPYAEALADELDDLPFERWLLDRVAAARRHRAGRGGGLWARPRHGVPGRRGARSHGIDLSPGMVAEARRRFPDGSYEVGDLRRLMRPTTVTGGARCWPGTR